MRDKGFSGPVYVQRGSVGRRVRSETIIHAGKDREAKGRSVGTGTLVAHIPVDSGRLAVDGREVLERTLRVGLHRLAALGPVRGTDFAVLILHRPAALLVSCLVPLKMKGRTYSELEGLDETDGLLDGAADGEVVDGDLPTNENTG